MPVRGDGHDNAEDERDNAADPRGLRQGVRPPLLAELALGDDPEDYCGRRAEEPAHDPDRRQHRRRARRRVLRAREAPVPGAVASRRPPIARRRPPLAAGVARPSAIAGRLLPAVPRRWVLACHDSSERQAVYSRPKRASCQTSQTARAATIPVTAAVSRVLPGSCRHRSARPVLRSTGRAITATAPHTAGGEARNAATRWPRPRSIPACVPPQNGHGNPVSTRNGHTVPGTGSQARTSTPDATAASRARALRPGLSPRHHAVTPQNAMTTPLTPRSPASARASMSRLAIPADDRVSHEPRPLTTLAAA